MNDTINPATTALLVLDHQTMLVEGYAPDPAAHLARVADLLASVRAADVAVIYVTVGFRPGYPEVADSNVMFSGVRSGGRFQFGDPQSAIPAAIAPRGDEPVVVKHRVSAFAGTDLAMLLRARKIETLAMFGIATSGVVTSTVRAAADLDYRLIVLKDLCADTDASLHTMLIDTLFPRQAETITADTFVARLPA